MNEKKGKFIFFISVITFIVMTAIIVFMESQWAEVQQNYVVRNTGYYLYVIMTTLFVFILEWAIKIHHLGTKRISIFHFCLTIDVLVVLYHFFFPHLITNIYAMIFIYLLVFALNFIVGRMDHVIIQNIKLYKQKLIKDAEKDVHKDQ